MKNIRVFQFLEVKVSIYLNRRVFVMGLLIGDIVLIILLFCRRYGYS